MFLDEQSPLTQVRGGGFFQPVSDADVDEMEAFFDERMAPVSISLTPFADPGLFTRLSRRGYEFGAFENVMVRAVDADHGPADPAITKATEEMEWSRMLAQTFFGEVTPMGLDLTRTLFAVPASINLVLRAGEEAAAGAQLDVRGTVGVFQCDGTLAAYRGMGMQSALIQARLALAAAAGCTLAAAETTPGSQSQRNYERAGFRVAYTRLTLLKPCF